MTSDPENEFVSPSHAATPSLAGSVAGWGWSLAGIALFAGGALQAAGLLPAQLTSSALYRTLDASPALLCCTGSLLFALGCGSRRTYRNSRALVSSLDPAGWSSTLMERTAGLENSLLAVRGAQELQAQGIQALDQRFEVSRQEARASSAKDSIFRLAASMDQLGARFDVRLTEVCSSLERSLYELSLRMESIRDDLEQRFQETIHTLGTLAAEETLATGFPEGFRGGHAEEEQEAARREAARREEELAHQRELELAQAEAARLRSGELAVELECLPTPPPDVDLGLLSTLGDTPSAEPEHGEVMDPLDWEKAPGAPPPPLPASLTETAYLRAQSADWWGSSDRSSLA